VKKLAGSVVSYRARTRISRRRRFHAAASSSSSFCPNRPPAPRRQTGFGPAARNRSRQAWPGGKKVAVCFVLYVEEWGYGHGPNFRSDTAGRDPDVVDESFRQYAIDFGVERVGRVFNEEGAPLSIALNALF